MLSLAQFNMWAVVNTILATPPDIGGLRQLSFFWTGFIGVGVTIGAAAFVGILLLRMMGIDVLGVISSFRSK